MPAAGKNLFPVSAWSFPGYFFKNAAKIALRGKSKHFPNGYNRKIRVIHEPLCFFYLTFLDIKRNCFTCFSAEMRAKVRAAFWDYEKTDDFSGCVELMKEENGRVAYVRTTHAFEEPGTYFPVLKAQSSRDGKQDDIFVQCRNLDRVRVVVE